MWCDARRDLQGKSENCFIAHTVSSLCPHYVLTLCPHSVSSLCVLTVSSHTVSSHTVSSHTVSSLCPHCVLTLCPHCVLTLRPHSASSLCPHSVSSPGTFLFHFNLLIRDIIFTRLCINQPAAEAKSGLIKIHKGGIRVLFSLRSQ